jgi:hypothetical protein
MSPTGLMAHPSRRKREHEIAATRLSGYPRDRGKKRAD